MTRRLALLACIAFLAIPVFAEDAELSAWFRTDARARPYTGVEAEVSATFEAARQAGLPLWVLMEKLREGAAKGVPAQRLAAGLQAESGRLAQARDILLRRKIAMTDSRARDETLKAISIGLLAGVSVESVEDLFAAAVPPAREPQDAVAALAAVIPVKDASRLPEEDLRRLGVALLGSRLPAAAFRSVSSFVLKARASGVRDADVLDGMVIRSLAAGGGLVQMEEELRIYLKRRGSR